MTTEIRAVHRASRGTYGSPRVHAVLRATRPVSRKRVARLMRQHGLQGCRLRRFCRTTQTNPAARAAPLLVAGLTPTAPDQHWAADITYVRTGHGWLYLAVILDAYSRRIIGWAMDSRLHTPLVLAALEMALGTRRPAQAIHHSDRGSQYTSTAYRARLAAHGLSCSMSRKGNCWDNARAESFFATLKTELIYRRTFLTRAEARSAIVEYIEVFYNRQRRHSALSYRTPVEIERLADAANAA